MNAAAYPVIGAMQMPAGFRYKAVFERGRPQHSQWDSFLIRHPPMSASHWAKIFAPFDALDGFDERIAGKEILYTARPELSEDDQAELNRKLNILRKLTCNGRAARENHVAVDVLYFVPCTDEDHFSFGHGGRYESITGTVLRAETGTLVLLTDSGEQRISFETIREIHSPAGIFSQEWESC